MLISPADAEAIERLLRKLQSLGDGEPAASSAQENGSVPRAELVARAEHIFCERRRRERFFSRSMFGEPAWDMMLAIYIMQGYRVSVSKLVSMVDVPQTTALRWLQYLEKERFIGKSDDPDDRRQVSVHLLDQGLEQIEAYLRSFPDNTLIPAA